MRSSRNAPFGYRENIFGGLPKSYSRPTALSSVGSTEVSALNLIERLVDDLGVTRQQAEGGAGLLLGFVQARLDDGPFVEIADTIPAISDIIGRAPRGDIAASRPLWALLSRRFGGLGGLYVLAQSFGKLGLDKSEIRQFVRVLLRYFGEQGGEEIEEILGGVLR